MRKKILYMIGSLDMGGAEHHIVQITPRLNKYYEIYVYSLTHKGLMAKELEVKGIKVISPDDSDSWEPKTSTEKLKRIALSAWLLFKVIRKIKPDVIHFFLPIPYLVGGFCAKLAGASNLIMSRRSLNVYQKRYPLITRLEYYLHRYMDCVVANSKMVRSELLCEGIPEDKLRVIYNGVDSNRIHTRGNIEKVRAELGVETNDLFIVIVANLIPYKGHEDLLRAIGSYRSELPDKFKLVCIGKDVNMQQSLEELAKALGIEKNVCFAGLRLDVNKILFSADMAILCSHQEGFSNSIIEYMFAGLPVIVTNVGGNSEAVIHECNGIVVPPKSIDKLGEAIVNLSLNKSLRQRMGDEGKRIASTTFTLDQCVANYKQLYDELLFCNRKESV